MGDSSQFCLKSGALLQNKHYRIFNGAPLTALSYSAVTLPIRRDKAYRLTFWKIVSDITSRNYESAVETAMTLEVTDVKEGQIPSLITKTIHSVVSPPNVSDERRYKRILTNVLTRVDTYLSKNELSIISTEEELSSMKSLIKELPAAVEKCHTLELEKFTSKENPVNLIPEGTDQARLAQSYLLARTLIDFLVEQMFMNQRFLHHPLPSEEFAYEQYLSIMRVKSLKGIHSVVEDGLMTGPFIENSIVGSILYLLIIVIFIAMIPATTYIIHRQTQDPEERARALAQKEAKLTAAKEAAEQEAKEAAEKEASENAAKEATEQEAKESAEKDTSEYPEKEPTEQEAKEAAEKDTSENAEKEPTEQEAINTPESDNKTTDKDQPSTDDEETITKDLPLEEKPSTDEHSSIDQEKSSEETKENPRGEKNDKN